jgi:hypothetical protein
MLDERSSLSIAEVQAIEDRLGRVVLFQVAAICLGSVVYVFWRHGWWFGYKQAADIVLATLFIVGLGGPPLFFRKDIARLRRARGAWRDRMLDICSRCRYDLSGAGTTSRCPECGLQHETREFVDGATPADESPPDPPANPNGG